MESIKAKGKPKNDSKTQICTRDSKFTAVRKQPVRPWSGFGTANTANCAVWTSERNGSARQVARIYARTGCAKTSSSSVPLEDLKDQRCTPSGYSIGQELMMRPKHSFWLKVGCCLFFVHWPIECVCFELGVGHVWPVTCHGDVCLVSNCCSAFFSQKCSLLAPFEFMLFLYFCSCFCIYWCIGPILITANSW